MDTPWQSIHIDRYSGGIHRWRAAATLPVATVEPLPRHRAPHEGLHLLRFALNCARAHFSYAVREAEERLLEKTRLTSELVLQALERAIFAGPRKLYDERGGLKPIHSLDEDTAAAIASLDTDERVTSSDPKRRAIGRTTKVRFVDKLVAIDRAMRHLGLYERNNRQNEANLTIHVGLVAAPPRREDGE